MKTLFCALALSMTLVPAMAQETATAPNPLQIQPSVKLDNGLIVTPVVLPRDDLREILDVQMWRFDIKPTVPDTHFKAEIELRTTGQKTKNLSAITILYDLPDETELTFAILPKGGSTFSKAETWKFHFANRPLGGEPAPLPYGFERSNPIKDLKWLAQIAYGRDRFPLKPQANGDILLMSWLNGDKDNSVLASLVLVLAAETPEPKN